MSEMETISLRIFGRDLTLACPPEEKDQLIKAAQLLNSELDAINDKNNALIIAGLTLANKLISNPDEKSNCLLYTSPSPRDRQKSRMPSSA